MGVSLWAVLGLALLLVSLPFVFLQLLAGSAYGVGAGAALGAGAVFLIVAVIEWMIDRPDSTPDEEATAPPL
jgi:ABC-type Fe3+-siderophore transport system permease subunit